MLAPELRSEPSESVELVGLDADDYVTLESNELIGILGLYGLPAPADLIKEIFNTGFVEQLRGKIKEGQFTLNGLLGTLQVRGNQLVQIAVSQNIIEQLQQLATAPKGTMYNLFGRCLMTDNVMASATSVLVTQHLAMTANVFTMMAFPGIFIVVGNETISEGQIPVALVVGDAAIYVGNHGTRPNLVLGNATRIVSEAANLQINFT
jgi:hypothetical protein